MRKRAFSFWPLLFLAAFTITLLAPQTGHAFWYGYQTLDEIAVDPNITDRFGNQCDVCADVETCDDLEAARDWLQGYVRGFENNPDNDVGITINEPGRWEGYTLLSCVGGCTHGGAPDPNLEYFALLIGADGEFVHGWDDINGIPAKLLPGGYVMGGAGGGFGGNSLVIQDWCGEEVWSWDVPNGSWHHDHNLRNSASGEYVIAPGQAPKMNGNRLVLTNHRPGMDYDYDKSEAVGGLSHPSYSTSHISTEFNLEGMDDAIYEVDHNGRIKWQWFATQHVDQMNFSEMERDAVATNCVGRNCRRGASDWTHFNNANWLGENPYMDDPRFHPDNIIFDSRTNGMIGIIAHDEKPGMWNKGDIIWQIGPGQHVFRDGVDIGPLIGPHNAHFIAQGNPGWGNVIVFDNGGNSTFGVLDYGDIEGCPPEYPSALRDFSRVLEIDPRTYEVIWSYENASPGFTDTHGNWNRKFFSSFISNMQRTPIGTTIITEGNQARIFEVNMDGQIIWEYMAAADPGGPGVIGRALYRSYRYPESYLPENWESMTCE